MNALAEAIDEVFNVPGQPKTVAFVLLTAKFGEIDGGRVNFITNGDRADVLAMMKEFIARSEGRYAGKAGRA